MCKHAVYLWAAGVSWEGGNCILVIMADIVLTPCDRVMTAYICNDRSRHRDGSHSSWMEGIIMGEIHAFNTSGEYMFSSYRGAVTVCLSCEKPNKDRGRLNIRADAASRLFSFQTKQILASQLFVPPWLSLVKCMVQYSVTTLKTCSAAPELLLLSG